MPARRSRELRPDRVAIELEITHQRTMIGIGDGWNTERGDVYAAADQDEIQLDARVARRKRRQPLGVGAAQSGRAHEQIDLVRTPEGIEVAGHDVRFL